MQVDNVCCIYPAESLECRLRQRGSSREPNHSTVRLPAAGVRRCASRVFPYTTAKQMSVYRRRDFFLADVFFFFPAFRAGLRALAFFAARFGAAFFRLAGFAFFAFFAGLRAGAARLAFAAGAAGAEGAGGGGDGGKGLVVTSAS